MLTYVHGVFSMFFKCNVQKHIIKVGEQNPFTLITNAFLMFLGDKRLKTKGFPLFLVSGIVGFSGKQNKHYFLKLSL